MAHNGGDAQGCGFVPEQLYVNDGVFLKHVVGHEAHSNFRGVVQGGAVMLRGAAGSDRDLQRPGSVIALAPPSQRRTVVAGALLCKAAKPCDLAREEFEAWVDGHLRHTFPTHEIQYDRTRTKRRAYPDAARDLRCRGLAMITSTWLGAWPAIGTPDSDGLRQ